MSQRITKKDLNMVIDHLREATGEDIQLSQAYGGYNAVLMCESGGQRDFVCWGHVPARELYDKLQAFKAGWYARERGL